MNLERDPAIHLTCIAQQHARVCRGQHPARAESSDIGFQRPDGRVRCLGTAGGGRRPDARYVLVQSYRIATGQCGR